MYRLFVASTRPTRPGFPHLVETRASMYRGVYTYYCCTSYRSYLTAVGVLSSVGHREQVLVPVFQLKAGGLVLELSAVDALAA